MYSKELLGLEGIPNIYVENISVSDSHEISQDVGSSITIDLCFNNALRGTSTPAFNYANQNTEPYVFRFINFYNLKTLDAFLLLKSEAQQQEYIREQRLLGNVKIEYMDLPRLDISKLRMDRLTKIRAKKKVQLSKTHSDYGFAVCIMKRNGSELGPTSSERVLRDGNVFKDSFYYVNSQTKAIWTGPVHSHRGVIMAGAFHSSTPHPTLERVLSRNFKIKDYRKTKTTAPVRTQSNLKLTDKYYFSNLEHSQGQGALANFMFSVNTRQMITKISKYSSTLKQYNQSVFNSIAQNVRIKRLRVSFTDETDKEQVAFSTFDEGDTLIEAFYYKQSKISPPIKSLVRRQDLTLFSRVSEIKLDSNPSFRTIGFQLNSKKVSNVKVFVEISDPFESYLQDLLRNGQQQKSRLSSYRSKIFSNKYYSRETKMFKKSALIRDYQGQTILWYSSVEALMNMRVLTEKMTDEAIALETDKAFENISPKTCTPESVDHFIKQMTQVLNTFVLKYSIKSATRASTTPAKSKGASARREYSMTKEYKINYNRSSRTISYFNTLDNRYPVPIITRSQFQSLLGNERAKYQGLSPDIDPTVFRNSPVVSFANDTKYDSSYLSPLVISNRNKDTSFTSLQNLSEEKLRDIGTSKLQSNFGSLFGRNLHVEVYEEPSAGFLRAPDVLSGQTNFTDVEQPFQKQILKKKPNPAIKNKMSSQMKQQRKISKMLDPSNQNNFFSNKGSRDALRLPFQLRLLFNEQQFNNVTNSRKNLLNNKPFTTAAAFFNLKKIIYYDSYRQDSNDIRMIGSPLIKEYNSQVADDEVLYCRLVQYEQSELKTINNFEDFTTINSFFIIVPDNFVFRKERITTRSVSLDRSKINLEQSRSRRYFQKQYLRSTVNSEPEERKQQIPLQSKRRQGALARQARANKKLQEMKQTAMKKDKYELNEEKNTIMDTKSSNKTIADRAKQKIVNERSQRLPSGRQQRARPPQQQQRQAPTPQGQQRAQPAQRQQSPQRSQGQQTRTPMRSGGGGGSGY